jgi:hypothetical protein
MREETIRIKLKDIRDSLEKVKSHLPQTLEEFLDLGLVKDGIYKKS